MAWLTRPRDNYVAALIFDGERRSDHVTIPPDPAAAC